MDKREAPAPLPPTNDDPFRGELAIYRNDEWIMGINQPHIDAVLEAIETAVKNSMFPEQAPAPLPVLPSQNEIGWRDLQADGGLPEAHPMIPSSVLRTRPKSSWEIRAEQAEAALAALQQEKEQLSIALYHKTEEARTQTGRMEQLVNSERQMSAALLQKNEQLYSGQRYDLVTNYRCGDSIEEMERSDDGEWIRFEDVAALLHAHAQLQAAIEALPALCDEARASGNTGACDAYCLRGRILVLIHQFAGRSDEPTSRAASNSTGCETASGNSSESR